jgi:hypothetical protein
MHEKLAWEKDRKNGDHTNTWKSVDVMSLENTAAVT